MLICNDKRRQKKTGATYSHNCCHVRPTAVEVLDILDKSPPPCKETPTSTKGPDEETTKHSTVPTDTSTEDHRTQVVQYSRPIREVKHQNN